MELVRQTGTVNDVTSAELREYAREHHEREYVLVDVRQPEEYGQGHIPGAHLLPLGELERRSSELSRYAGRTLIFYCRSGGRSARASGWVSRELGLPRVAHLLGGFSGWQGRSLPDFPRLKIFDLGQAPDRLLCQGLELEKGTYLLYDYLGSRLESGPTRDLIADLARAELAHARGLHGLISRISPDRGTGDFETVFAQLRGDVIESGQPFETVVARARELEDLAAPALLELALEIELSAYELYKELASAVTDAEPSRVLTELAQQEKQHSEIVLKALGTWAAHSQSSLAS